MAEAQAQGADVIMTDGVIKSNHGRQTAAFAAKLGMQCHLILRNYKESDGPAYNNSGNVLLDNLLGAIIEEVHRDTDIDAHMQATAKKMRAEGKNVFIVPVDLTPPVHWGMLNVRMNCWTRQLPLA